MLTDKFALYKTYHNLTKPPKLKLYVNDWVDIRGLNHAKELSLE